MGDEEGNVNLNSIESAGGMRWFGLIGNKDLGGWVVFSGYILGRGEEGFLEVECVDLTVFSFFSRPAWFRKTKVRLPQGRGGGGKPPFPVVIIDHSKKSTLLLKMAKNQR